MDTSYTPPLVRIYSFGGTQHGPASDPPERGIADNLANPGDYRPFLRALLDTLDAWVQVDKDPPASLYPRIDKGTLVDWRQRSTRFPALPGVRYPEVIQQPPALFYGPQFPKLHALLAELDSLHEAIARARFYATAREHTEATDAEANDLATLARDRLADLESLLLFVDLEWLALEDAEAEALLAAPELETYAHRLRVAREEKPYVLPEGEEQALNARRPAIHANRSRNATAASMGIGNASPASAMTW